MDKQHPTLIVYGRELVCASCVDAPDSLAPYEWHQAAIGRKYRDIPFTYEYVDMDKKVQIDKHKEMVERIKNDDFF